MDYGERILTELLNDIKSMSKEEYLKLYSEAKEREQIEIAGSDAQLFPTEGVQATIHYTLTEEASYNSTNFIYAIAA